MAEDHAQLWQNVDDKIAPQSDECVEDGGDRVKDRGCGHAVVRWRATEDFRKQGMDWARVDGAKRCRLKGDV